MYAIGLMSGTSLDGIDAAIVETDGRARIRPGPWLTLPYDALFQDRLRACLGKTVAPPDLIAELTRRHGEAVEKLLEKAGLSATDIGVVGFHGQTLFHDPDNGLTVQIGDGAALSAQTGITVVNDFRSADVAAGGQGAPLVPIFHKALLGDHERPVAILNIGGVANVTYVGIGDGLLAFDTGPGNALIDDWMRRHSNSIQDEGGATAAAGVADNGRLATLMRHPYFSAPLPKSLDRNSFDPTPVEGLSLHDGAATLTAFTAKAIALAVEQLPAPPLQWYLCGGGRHNRTLVSEIALHVDAVLAPCEALGWNGDALEAYAFGYLAVRTLQGLPITFPGTTGVTRPMPGGVIHHPPR